MSEEATATEAAADETPKAAPKNPVIVAAKEQIKALKSARQAAVEAKDAKQLKIARRRIGRLKRKIRRVKLTG